MPEKQRNLVWPILLILAGVLLLGMETGVLPVSWEQVWRLWPVALILLGLAVLLGYVRHGWVIFGLLAVGVVIAAVVLLPRVQTSQSTQTRHLAYPASGVTSANVDLSMGVGRVEVSTVSDAANLLEADVTFNPARTTLEESFDNQDGEATLRIRARTSSSGLQVNSKAGEEWAVRLNADVPTHLVLNAGVSELTADLAKATLSQLEINAGVGDVRISLPAQGAYSVSVNGGVGSLRLDLPESVEARVHVDGGLGELNVDNRFEHSGKDYTTAGYDRASERVEIDIDGGVGSITVN